MNWQDDESGLTLVELMVVMVITLLLTGLVMSFTLDFWGRTTSLQNSSDTLVARQSLGDSLRDNLNRAIALAVQPSIADSQTLVPDPAHIEGTFWLPVHAVPVTVSKPATGQYAPVLYFVAPSVQTNRTQIMNGAQPYQDEFVMYLSGSGELRLRTLANPGASGNRIRTSCTPGNTTALCPADKLLATDVSSVSSRYFSRSGNLQNWQSIVDPNTGDYIGPDMPTVEVVELTIGFQRKATLKKSATVKNETTVRVALRNG